MPTYGPGSRCLIRVVMRILLMLRHNLGWKQPKSCFPSWSLRLDDSQAVREKILLISLRIIQVCRLGPLPRSRRCFLPVERATRTALWSLCARLSLLPSHLYRSATLVCSSGTPMFLPRSSYRPVLKTPPTPRSPETNTSLQELALPSLKISSILP